MFNSRNILMVEVIKKQTAFLVLKNRSGSFHAFQRCCQEPTFRTKHLLFIFKCDLDRKQGTGFSNTTHSLVMVIICSELFETILNNGKVIFKTPNKGRKGRHCVYPSGKSYTNLRRDLPPSRLWEVVDLKFLLVSLECVLFIHILLFLSDWCVT